VGKVQRGDDLIRLDGGSLGALSFVWSKDRYRHFWTFSDCDLQIHSLESSSEDTWPISPPLQQIHSQSFGDGREVIFGVGMAGRGHWSASFTLVPDLKSWIVELACRSNLEPERLLSSYRLERGPGSSRQPMQEAQKIVLDEQSIVLEAISPSTRAEYTAADKSADDGNIQESICFQPVELDSSSATRQWAFRLKVEQV
jgi:hypothetical protein